MPPKKRKDGGDVAGAMAPKTAGSGKDAMKVPQNVTFGNSFLKDAPFTCTLCKSRIDKGTQTLSHFKNHHKITKPAAIEKLVTLGVVLYDPPDDGTADDYPTTTTTTPKSKPSNKVNKTPNKTSTSGSGEPNITKASQQKQVAPEAPVTGPYAKGDIVLAHITGYPWWPGIVQRLELDRQGELIIDIRFFDKDMMTGKVKVASIKDFKDYPQYLKSKRKALGASTLGKLRQAHEFALKVRSKPAPWRHTYFCVEKHTMFDYNANHDTTEIEEEPLTRRQQQLEQTTSPANDNKKANSSSYKRLAAVAAPATEEADKEATAAIAAKTAKLDHQEAANSEKEESSEVPEPASAAAVNPPTGDQDNGDDESDFDEDGCENDVNDVLNEMGYDN